MIKLVNKIACKVATVVNDVKGSPAIETAAIIVFIGLLVISKADGVGDAIGGAFDAVIRGITNGLPTTSP